MNWYNLIKLSQSNIIIDIKDYTNSLITRLNETVDRSLEQKDRLTNYNFDINYVINIFKELKFDRFIPFLNDAVNRKDSRALMKLAFALHDRIKKGDYNTNRYNLIKDAYKKIRDLSDSLDHQKGIGLFTEKDAKELLDKLTKETYVNMEKISQNIKAAISRISNFSTSIVIKASEIYKENNIEAETDALIEFGNDEMAPSFSYFVNENSIELDDILEGGNEDEFFKDNKIQSDYFNLIKELRNPGSTSKAGKILTLYTARPVKDRNIYLDSKIVPSGIFLTDKLNSAEGLAIDLGGNRDVWKIRIDSRYSLNTLDSPYEKQYQVVGEGQVPVLSMTLISPYEKE